MPVFPPLGAIGILFEITDMYVVTRTMVYSTEYSVQHKQNRKPVKHATDNKYLYCQYCQSFSEWHCSAQNLVHKRGNRS